MLVATPLLPAPTYAAAIDTDGDGFADDVDTDDDNDGILDTDEGFCDATGYHFSGEAEATAATFSETFTTSSANFQTLNP